MNLVAVAVCTVGAGAVPALAEVPSTRCDAAALPGISTYFSRLKVVAPAWPGLVPPGHAPGAVRPSAADLKELTRRVGAWQDWGRVADAVLGDPTPDELIALAGAIAGRSDRPRPCSSTLQRRDRLVATLVSFGYGSIEIADIVSGRLMRSDIDRAYALKSAGHAAAAVTYLERALVVRSAAPSRPAPGPVLEPDEPERRLLPAPVRPPARRFPALDTLLVRYALANGVDPALARAVLSVESGGHARAISSSGAIGLMQLMPATAAMLGVDPQDPLDNLQGGLRYLGGLLREYGSVRDALVAYNAGPTHATRVRRGEVVLYGETRRYLDAIARHYPVGR